MEKSAFIIEPMDNKYGLCHAYGFYTMDEVLGIPSTKLVWLEASEATEKNMIAMLENLYECADPDYTRIVRATSSKVPKRHSRMSPCTSPDASVMVLREPAFASRLDSANKAELLERAKKRPVLLTHIARNIITNRKLPKGFILETEFVDSTFFQLLRYNPKECEQEEEKKKEKRIKALVFPRGYVTLTELRRMCRCLEVTLRKELRQTAIPNSHLGIDIRFRADRKWHACASIVNIYALGVKLRGKTFWKKNETGTVCWIGNRRMFSHTAREIAQNWKDKKLKKPANELARRVWDIVQEVRKAPAREC